MSIMTKMRMLVWIAKLFHNYCKTCKINTIHVEEILRYAANLKVKKMFLFFYNFQSIWILFYLSYPATITIPCLKLICHPTNNLVSFSFILLLSWKIIYQLIFKIKIYLSAFLGFFFLLIHYKKFLLQS